MNTGNTDAIPADIEQISVDFSDAKQAEGVFNGVDIVIHLAALVDVSSSLADRPSFSKYII